MFEELLAKSEKNNKPSETIKLHTSKLLIRYGKFKSLYPNALSEREWELLRLACEYHDVGKANTKFQNKLRPLIDRINDIFIDIDEVPHAYLSCAYMPIDDLLDKYSEEEVTILLSAVYYHHERNEEITANSEKIIEYDLIQYVPLMQKDFNVREEPLFDYGEFTDREIIKQKPLLYKFVRIKGLLNKIDYAASGDLEVEESHNDLIGHLDSIFEKNDLQEYLYNNPHESHVVIASTGIGKTEGALYWIGNDKGIFTLPLKVSINAIFDRIYKEFNYTKVGLLHSDSYLEYMKRHENHEFSLSALNHTKNLAMPLTITTLDQVIDFVGLYPGFELKLAIFSYSKLVIDEIQMYSPRLAAFIIMGLKYITDLGGKFLIMTATLPPLFIEALENEKIPFKQPDKPFLKLNNKGEVISRHVMTIRECDLTVEVVLQQSINQKVLIIVNTVSKAQSLFYEFERLQIPVSLLHSRFIKKNRKEKEDAIKKSGEKDCDKTGIWITTQLVEASIDIDFDILFTELSEATGLFQRMGRVYRGRDYKATSPNIYVYTGEKLPSGISEQDNRSVVDYTIYEKSKEVLLKYNNQPISEKVKMQIVQQIYRRDVLGDDCNYIKEFDETLTKLKNTLPYEEKEPPTLRDIQNVFIIPQVVYEENETLINVLHEQLKSRNLSNMEKLNIQNQLQDFIVDIPYWAFQTAKKKGLIGFTIEVNRFIKYPVVAFKYSYEAGLEYKIDEGAYFM